MLGTEPQFRFTPTILQLQPVYGFVPYRSFDTKIGTRFDRPPKRPASRTRVGSRTASASEFGPIVELPVGLVSSRFLATSLSTWYPELLAW